MVKENTEQQSLSRDWNLPYLKLYFSKHQKQRRGLVTALLCLGVLARFLAMKRGHNFDFDSWNIVGDIAKNGGNVYAETVRYNYGPVWYLLLGLFKGVAGLFSHPGLFRYSMVGFLTLVDLGIWFMLKKYFGYVAAFLFFLSPISIIITGLHNQFENIAILLALLSVAVYGKPEGPLTKRKINGLLLLGLSLATKHVFFAFPLWMAVKQRGLKEKILIMLIPIAVFLASFIPFWPSGREGIINNVFKYQSVHNAPFWHIFIPVYFQNMISPGLIFATALVLFAFIVRKRPIMESLLIYTLVLVIFSPSVATQYLTIVVAAIAVFLNLPFVLYVIYATILLGIAGSGLGILRLENLLPSFLINPVTQDVRSLDLPILWLFLGLLWLLFRKQIIRITVLAYSWLNQEYKYQLKNWRD